MFETAHTAALRGLALLLEQREQLHPMVIGEMRRHVAEDVCGLAHQHQNAEGVAAEPVGDAPALHKLSNGAALRDGWATEQIAAPADRHNIERLVVVTVLVFTGGTTAVVARLRLGMRQSAGANFRVHSGKGDVFSKPVGAMLAAVAQTSGDACGATVVPARSSRHFDGRADAALRTNQRAGLAATNFCGGIHSSPLLCFGLGDATLSTLCLVQRSKSSPKLVAHGGVVISGQITDAGLCAPALLGDLHLREAPSREV